MDIVPKKVGGDGVQSNRGVGLGLKNISILTGGEENRMAKGIGWVINLLGRRYYKAMTSDFSRK